MTMLSQPRLFRRCSCAFALHRSFSTALPHLAPFRFTPLPSRALLPLAGPDAPKFLQGLISNDVAKLGQPRDPLALAGDGTIDMLFAAVLKADGRILHDVFLYKDEVEGAVVPAFLLEADAASIDSLRTYLKRHVLRSKVKLGKGADEGKEVLAAWRTEEEVGEGEFARAEGWLRSRRAGKDERAPGMGWRWAGLKDGESPPSDLFERGTPKHYHLHRLTLAVPEGAEDWPPLPLEANLDLMGGVDYKKGCYVGQELTARTHHRGVVRKRGVVLRLFREGEDVPTSILPSTSPLTPFPNLFPLPPPLSTLTALSSTVARPRPSGKLGSSLPLTTRTGQSLALAFGSVRLEHISEATSGIFVVKAKLEDGAEVGEGRGESEEEGGRWLAKAFVPEWVETRLAEEEEKKAR